MAIVLNVGCGPLRIEGEIGVDKYPTAGADVIADMRALPYGDGTVDRVRLDHVLEHQPVREAVTVLFEMWRVLKPGGTIRVGVPDLWATCLAYVTHPSFADKAGLVRNLYGGQAHPGEYHKSGWDRSTLRDLLESVGFVVASVKDDPERTEGICIAAEATKPA